MMAKAVGGPLLSVADLIHDLSEDSSLQPTSSDDQPSALPPSCSETFVSRSESLDGIFETTYKELNLALTSSGHSWTSLTQRLYSALTSADQVVAVVNSNLKSLAEKITGLKATLVRGDAVIGKLQVATVEPQGDRV